MSGILGQLLGGLTGAQGTQAGAGLTSVVGQLLGGGQTSQGGGLQGLIAQLDQAGLGDKVRSWIGAGQNEPVSPDQLAQALPAEQVQGWSQQTGLAPSALLASLSQILPQAVDQATPNGTVPDAPVQNLDVAGIVGRLVGGPTRVA